MIKSLNKNFDKNINNKGVTLVELIVVIAIMAVLTSVIVPSYLKYVGKSKRIVDARNAAEIAKTMNILVAAEPELTNEVDGRFMVAIMWNKDSRMGNGTDIYSEMFRQVGTVPVSKTNKNYFWYMTFAEDPDNPGYCKVGGIYLKEKLNSSMGYELYPNSSAFVDKQQMVKLP